MKTVAEPEKSETMTTDPAMARLMLEGPKELKAITVNGQIIVETEDDRERCNIKHTIFLLIIISLRKRAERAAKRKSRLDCAQMEMLISSQNFACIPPDGTQEATTKARSTLPRGCRPL